MTGSISPSEVAVLRADTAGCSADGIFFNNAGASLPPRPVVERVIEHLRLEESLGAYEAADRVAAEREAVYASLAKLVNAAPEEIAVTESATRAWDMAFYSLKFSAGDRIVTARNEYSSNCIALLQMAKRTGAEITVVPSEASGEIDLEALERTLDAGGVKLVALTHIATNNGMVQPAAAVGRLTRPRGVPFLIDACQSVGQMALDVEALGCDMLSATGRKYLRGPRGTGFLYVRRAMLETLEPAMLDNHAARWSAASEYTVRPDARRFETYEASVALALGLRAAAEYALALGLARIEARVQALAAQLREGLARIDGVRVTDTGRVRSGIVIFLHERVPAERLVARFAEQWISVFSRPAFETRLDADRSAMGEQVRASVHYYNTEDEVERFCAAIAEIVAA